MNSESLFNILYIEIKHKYQKICRGTKQTLQKNALFLCELQLITVLHLILRFLHEVKRKVRFSRTLSSARLTVQKCTRNFPLLISSGFY